MFKADAQAHPVLRRGMDEPDLTSESRGVSLASAKDGVFDLC